jgi:very-short-patch-repair endonuclease
MSLRKYSRHLKPFARRLRGQMTDAELTLWTKLRRKQIRGIQFYRQRPIGDYIVDFYAPSAKLVVEVDGSQHLDPHRASNDAVRDAYLRDQGLRVLRFNNLQVLRELEAVVESIFEAVSSRVGENPP